jgi:hypothetical protein
MIDETLILMRATKRPATVFAFDFARRALRAAEIENARIWNAPYVEGDVRLVIAAMQDVLVDVHFFFIAIRNVYRFLNLVVQDPAFESFRPVLEQLNDRWFRHYSSGREAFEHIDQRLPGEKHSNQLSDVHEEGGRRKVHYGLSLRNGVFRHSDKEWDIRAETFAQFHADVTRFLTTILDAAEKSIC